MTTIDTSSCSDESNLNGANKHKEEKMEENFKGFAIANVLPGKLNALVKNIMKQTGTDDPNEAVRLVNSGEWLLDKKWKKKDGIIRFSVTSKGFTHDDYVKRFKKQNVLMSPDADRGLYMPEFQATEDVEYEIALISFEKEVPCRFYNTRIDFVEETVKTIAIEKNLKLVFPSLELAYLIRNYLSDEEIKAMGFDRITVMHKAVKIRFHQCPIERLILTLKENGCYTLSSDKYYFRYEYDQWKTSHAFAFLIEK